MLFTILLYCPPSPAFSLHSPSTSAFLTSFVALFSHLNCGLLRLFLPHSFHLSAVFGSPSSSNRTKCPTHFSRLFTSVPIKLVCTPISLLSSSILLLSTLLTPTILLTQLFSQACSLCCCCCSVNANISRLCRHASVTHE